MSHLFPQSQGQIRNCKTRAKGRAVVNQLLSLFDASVLNDETAVDAAVGMLDHLLSDTNFSVEDVFAALGSTPYLTEFILCVASDYAFGLLTQAVLRPPSNDPDGLRCWIVSKLLTSFSDNVPRGASSALTAHREEIECTSAVLIALSQLLETGDLPDDSGEISLSRGTSKARQEKHNKGHTAHSGRIRRSSGIETITEYGMDVPTTKSQAMDLVKRVVDEQTGILEIYLNAFRTNEVAAVYRVLYLPYLLAMDDAVQTLQEEPHRAEGGELGPWRILMSPRAERDLRKVRREDKKRLKIILRKLKDLALGYFTPDNYKMLAGGDIDIPVYETKMTRDSRLIYYIDCTHDQDMKGSQQVIKLCGIYTHAQIDQRFWDSVSRNLRTKSLDADYRKRCVFRKKDPKKESVYLPQTFPSSDVNATQESQAVSSSAVTEIVQEYQDQIQELLMISQFMTFSRDYLKCIIEDQDIASVFDISWLSAREIEIMYHPYSCFVLGRGGTGKTTTMIYRMLAQERSWADRFHSTMRKPRQLFVTQSQVLVQKVEEYYARRSQSFTPAHLRKDLKTIVAGGERKPLLVDADEEVYWNAALPKRYGALKDEDFPMFLTFDHLCRLLEGEFQYMVEHEKTAHAQVVLLRDILRLRLTSVTQHRKGYIADPRGEFIDYDTFLEKYWAHLPYALRDAQLSPELVFGEIMGVIKGSEWALESKQGYLDQDTYCGIRRRSHATSDSQRSLIYCIFEAYTKRKKQYGQYDAADRTRMLLKCLETAPFSRDMLPKFIYVDEAQDNLLIDALVLRKLCSNAHGMFWAGDTAQTISAGSAFRFDELRSFMYRVNQSEDRGIHGTQPQSETFHLTTNFRSHAGIVNCAHSIVKLLMKYWPDSVDRLPEERGQVSGRKPLFFSDRDGAELHRALFQDSNGGGCVEFGTEQCILVRNNAARQRLREEMGGIGQILTIYESKGLEFNDVLLYCPFADSNIDIEDWGILLNEVPGHTGPVFDVGKHAGVCRELKHLYVAITRARRNLWILDCSQAASPMLLVWASRGLVDIHPQGAPVPRLAVPSGKEQWAEAARNLFRKRHYLEAMHGFERAGLRHEQQVSLAYLSRDQARSTAVNPQTGISQATAFAKAADVFIKVAEEAEDVSEQKTYFRIAAECYTRTGDDRKAGIAYRSAREYALAAQHFRAAGSFDDAVQIVKEHHNEVPPEVSQRIMDVSKLQYIRENRVERARALQLFEDDDEALDYMDDYGFDSSRASYLEKLGRFGEAAEYYLAEGNCLEAVRLLLRNGESQESTEKAVRHIINGLWEHLSLCTPEANWDNPVITSLLGHAETVNKSRWVTSAARTELSMFRSVVEDDLTTLSSLGDTYAQQDNLAATILCLDQVFSHVIDLESADLDEILACFGPFLELVRALQRLACVPDPCNSPDIQKLLAFTVSSEEMFAISKACHLFTLCNSRSTPNMEPTSGGMLVPRWELEPLIRKTLRDRLEGHVEYQNEIAHQLGPRVQPCILFARDRRCPKDVCKQLHIPETAVTTTYNTIIRIRLIQVMIYHTLYACDIPFVELHKQQRTWLRRLYEALYPSHVKLGTLHALSFDFIPELRHARPILMVWVRDFLNRIDPREDPPKAFLVNLMRATRLAMQFDRHATTENLPRIPCAVRCQRPPQLVRTTPHGPQYIVHDLVGTMPFKHVSALDKGVRFLNHVLQRRVFIDVGVLCDFMDHLCSAMLIAARSYHGRKPGWKCLHGLVLPTTLWIRIASDADNVATMNTREIRKYISCVERLLQGIYIGGSDAGHLLVETRDMSDTGINQTRMMYLERICKNLFLWGHNLPFSEAKQEVLKVLASLRNQPTSFDLQKRAASYTAASDWSLFTRAILPSFHDIEFDPLVQLHHRSVPPSTGMGALRDVKTVVFSRVDEILGQLHAEHIPMLSSEFGFDVLLSSWDNSSPHAPVISTPSSEQEIEGDDTSDIPQAMFTPEEATAGVKIVAMYRKYMERKAVEKDALTEMRRRVFADFQAKSEAMEWPNSSSVYNMLFRRVVPRLVLVTECLKDYLHKAKKVAKARVHDVHHHELEDVQSALNEVSKRFKDACALHKALVPVSASVHRTCDMVKLVEYAHSVDRLHDWVYVQLGQSPNWQVDIRIAIALITKFNDQQS